MLGKQLTQAAAGAAGASEGLYVDDVFSTYLYDGTGGTQTITNGIDLAGEGGAVWFKVRNFADSHTLQDSERKTGTYYDDLTPNEINESQTGRPWGISSMNSDGFTIGGSNAQINSSSYNYVSWTFRKAPGFFDIVTYSGNGSTQTISHNLGSVPGCIIIKRTDSNSEWSVYHRSIGNNQFIKLDDTAPASNFAGWNNTTPTSTSFYLGNDAAVNSGSGTYIAYLFAHDDQSFGTASDESIIKCGTFTTDSTGVASVDLGFEAQFALIKRTDSSQSWYLVDTMRNWIAITGSSFSNFLRADGNNTENVSGLLSSPTSSGFDVDISGSATYIYMAIRRSHKPATAGTEVFSADDQSSGSGTGGVSFSAPSFPIDLMIAKRKSSNADWAWMDRLRGYDKNLRPHNSNAEAIENYLAGFDQNSGYTVGSNGGVLNETDSVTWCFKRAAGFFDMVAYEGTGSARTIAHNLGAVPKMIIAKKRDSSESWSVYHEAYGNNKNIWLNDNSGGTTNARWNNTTPTDSVFSVGTDTGTNASGADYIAYLFGDVSGISKVGSYTGTGGNIDVDCGFTAGARFVLIKRYGGVGEWHLWDTTRGIIAGNDPYLELNAIAPEKTTFDYLDPLNAGFTVTSTANADLNTSGGTYLFLAIA